MISEEIAGFRRCFHFFSDFNFHFYSAHPNSSSMSFMSMMGQKASSVRHLPWCGCEHSAGLMSGTHEAQPAAALMYVTLNSVYLHTTATPDIEWQQQDDFMQHWNVKLATWWFHATLKCETGNLMVSISPPLQMGQHWVSSGTATIKKLKVYFKLFSSALSVWRGGSFGFPSGF